MNESLFVACPSCDLQQEIEPLPPGAAAHCGRCGDRLQRRPRRAPQVALALVVTAITLFVIGNAFPLVSFELAGRSQTGLLISGVIALYREGYWELAALVAFTTMVAPAIYLLALLYVLLGLVSSLSLPCVAPVLRAVRLLMPWAMMEVYTVGILVAVVKLGDFGDLVPGTALAAFLCLTLLIAAINRNLDLNEIWRFAVPEAVGAPATMMPRGHWACGSCGLMMLPLAEEMGARGCCPRCGADVGRRKADSMSRTWALLLAGFVLYVPANLFPVMTIVSFGTHSTSTIFAGVVELAQAGMWPIAGVVFLASIVIPVLKLLSLGFVAASVQWQWPWRPMERTRLYRMVEGIGRWSMIDIFVISILAALIQLQNIATIEPSLGALCFASVVVLTMFAAASFDPRLIWDHREKVDEQQR